MKYSITLDNEGTKILYFVIIGAAYYEISLSKSQIINKIICSNYKSKETTFNIGSKIYDFPELASKGEEVLNEKIENFLKDEFVAYKILMNTDGEFIKSDDEVQHHKIMECILKEFIITGMNKFDLDCFVSTFFPTDADEREFRDEKQGNSYSYSFSKRVLAGNELKKKLIERYRYITTKYEFYSVIINSFCETGIIRNTYENHKNLKEDIIKAKKKLLELDNITNIKNQICHYKTKPYKVNYYYLVSEMENLEKVKDIEDIESFETIMEIIVKHSIKKVEEIFLKNNYFSMILFKTEDTTHGIERCDWEDDRLIKAIIDKYIKITIK